MGAKTCILAFSDRNPAETLRLMPALDKVATKLFVERLFPAARITQSDDVTLAEAYPNKHEVYAGCFPGLSIVAVYDVAVDRPSSLPVSFLRATKYKNAYLHAMHSVVDWFAYATWEDSQLTRSLSVSPDNGVIEDLGVHRPFERDYWVGSKSIGDNDYPLKFHPLEMGEEALLDLFGFQLEGSVTSIDPFLIPLCGFVRKQKFLGLF